ncbi:MAG: Maf family protein [Peptococcaceae bacterium]|nr:Maf family protein [Peptococcaceae bacterium]
MIAAERGAAGCWRQPIIRADMTLVEFRRLDETVIEWYLSTGEGADKAAGYAIQGLGRRLVARCEGSETNVIGLPVEIVVPVLDELGIHRDKAG